MRRAKAARAAPGVTHYQHQPIYKHGSQEPDARPGAYYVTVKDGARVALLAGPWDTHAQALAMVEPVRTKACEVDPRGVFYAFGTGRLPNDDSVPIRAGKLNKYFDLKC